jgi:hypothetical protein
MIAFKTRFDGKQVILSPDQLRKLTPGEVILILGQIATDGTNYEEGLKAQEETAKKVWDNDADSIYDQD